MEEADMLADNIAIMKRGELICLGSALRLKSKFGSGYRVAVVTEDASINLEPVKQLVFKYSPKAAVSRESPGVVHFEVPSFDANQLPLLLKDIETNGKSFRILDTQVGMTSLEDVFLKVAGLETDIPLEGL